MPVHALYLINCPHKLFLVLGFFNMILYPEERPSSHLAPFPISRTRLQTESSTRNSPTATSNAKLLRRTTLHQQKRGAGFAGRAGAPPGAAAPVPLARSPGNPAGSTAPAERGGPFGGGAPAAAPPTPPAPDPAPARAAAVPHRGAEAGAQRGGLTRSRETRVCVPRSRTLGEWWPPPAQLQAQ